MLDYVLKMMDLYHSAAGFTELEPVRDGSSLACATAAADAGRGGDLSFLVNIPSMLVQNPSFLVQNPSFLVQNPTREEDVTDPSFCLP